MIYYTNYNSPLGELILTSDGDNLNGLYFKEQIQDNKLKSESKNDGSIQIFNDTKIWLDDYFGGKNPSIKNLKIKPEGTKFQKKVWKILTEIPYGKTTSYKEIAKKFETAENKKTSPRAIGGAIGKNPILIVIPCHRIIGSNKSLTGYSAGIENKIKLLKLENINLSGLYNPITGYKL